MSQPSSIEPRIGLDMRGRPTHGHLPHLPLCLNGHGPFWFLFDTGAQGCDISPRVIKALGVEATDGSVPLSELRIGSLVWNDLRMGTGDTQRIEQVLDHPIDGMLGGALMSWGKLAIRIDYPCSQSALWRSDGQPLPDAITIQIKDHYLLVPVHVNETGPHLFLLDTGSSFCAICPELAQTLGLPLIRPTSTRGVLSILPGHDSIASSIRLAGVEARDLDIIVEPFSLTERRVGAPIVGRIGHSFLRHCTMTLDYPQQLLSLHRP
ncbi:MAG TPA: aspartyl protease family protein [Chloroflexota bacterium]|nr:aspartyl protease family protein [Chloroflexota bacterium]